MVTTAQHSNCLVFAVQIVVAPIGSTDFCAPVLRGSTHFQQITRRWVQSHVHFGGTLLSRVIAFKFFFICPLLQHPAGRTLKLFDMTRLQFCPALQLVCVGEWAASVCLVCHYRLAGVRNMFVTKPTLPAELNAGYVLFNCHFAVLVASQTPSSHGCPSAGLVSL